MSSFSYDVEEVQIRSTIKAMSDAGAIYMSDTIFQMVVSAEDLESRPEKLAADLIPFVRPSGRLIGLKEYQGRDGLRYTLYWATYPQGEEKALEAALGAPCDHQVWSDETRAFIPNIDPWPAEFVEKQFLICGTMCNMYSQ